VQPIEIDVLDRESVLAVAVKLAPAFGLADMEPVRLPGSSLRQSGRIALRMLVVFWAVMSAAGLATEYLFKAVGLVLSIHPSVVARDSFGFNYATVLDVVALFVFAGL